MRTFDEAAIWFVEEPKIKLFSKPKMVVTSLPYPAVHILYHRAGQSNKPLSLDDNPK